ncbi:glycosyltransferase family 4 protein [Rhodopirellula baltica]
MNCDILHCDRIDATAIWGLVQQASTELPEDVCVTACQVRGFKSTDRSFQFSPPIQPIELTTSRLHAPAISRPFESIAFLFQFRKLVRELTPSIIHVHFALPGVLCRLVTCFLPRRSVRLVSTCHEKRESLNPLLRAATRILERRSDAVVYVSETVAKSYRPNFVLGSEGKDERDARHRVIYNCIDVEHIRSVVRQALQHPAPNWKVGSLVLLSVGRLVPEKGHGTVIAALPDLVRLHPGLKYVILGEGPNRDALLQQAKSLGVAKHLELPGWVDHDEAIRQMVAADAVVMPSHSVQEGFGLALAEAMLCETPIIASRVPVFEEVAGGESAVLRFFTEGDPQALAEQAQGILTCLSEPKDFQPLVDRVTQRFDVQRMAQAYAELYQQLL